MRKPLQTSNDKHYGVFIGEHGIEKQFYFVLIYAFCHHEIQVTNVTLF